MKALKRFWLRFRAWDADYQFKVCESEIGHCVIKREMVADRLTAVPTDINKASHDIGEAKRRVKFWRRVRRMLCKALKDMDVEPTEHEAMDRPAPLFLD